MKQKLIGAALACAMLASAGTSAGAVSPADMAGLGVLAGVTSVLGALESGKSPLPPLEDAQSISFGGIEKRVRSSTAVKSMEKQLSGVKNTDLEAEFFNQRLQYQQMASLYQGLAQAIRQSGDNSAAAQANLKYYETQYGIAAATLKGLDDAEEDAQDSLDDSVVSVEKQIENQIKSMVVQGQNLYMGLLQMESGLAELDRGLDTVDRNITAVEKQVEIGMASRITLDNLRQTRRELVSQRESVLTQKDLAERGLALLCGQPSGTRVTASGTPSVQDKDLRAMNYEKDLAQAKKNSYAIWAQQDAVREASNKYEDDVTASVDTYESAKLLLEATVSSTENSFRSLYDDVQDKNRLVGEAQAALEMQQKNFDVSKVQYERGMLSKLDYLSAQDELAAKKDALSAAERELFTAYNTYDWARRGFMSSAG